MSIHVGHMCSNIITEKKTKNRMYVAGDSLIYFFNHKRKAKPRKIRIAFIFCQKETEHPKWLIMPIHIGDMCANIIIEKLKIERTSHAFVFPSSVHPFVSINSLKAILTFLQNVI